MENIKDDVRSKFSEIRNALHMREKLLLRQADVIMQQTKQQQVGRGSMPLLSSSCSGETREVKFLTENENDLLAAIRNFGRFQLDNMNLTLQDIYLRNEDYITPVNDHETMYKCLQQTQQAQQQQQQQQAVSNEFDSTPQQNEDYQPEAIVVDFSRNKTFIESNAKHMNKSIINITLQEARELIKKARMRRELPIPPLNLEELDDEVESSIADAVSSLGHDPAAAAVHQQTNKQQQKTTKSSKKCSANRLKPKITINNCNGTINLRNISNLTINYATDDSISAQIPFQQSENENSTTPPVDAKQQQSVPVPVPVPAKEIDSSTSSIHQSGKFNDQAIISSTDELSTSTTTTTATTASNSDYSCSSASSCSQQQQKRKQSKVASTIKKSQSSYEQTTYDRQHGCMTVDYDDINDDDDDGDGDDRNNMDSQAKACDFYNRLLNEIKNSLRTKRSTNNNDNKQNYSKNHEKMKNENTTEAHGTCSGSRDTNIPENHTTEENPTTNCSSYVSFTTTGGANLSQSDAGTSHGGRRLVLKNFENLRVVLEANSSDDEAFHPVQIEQWLAEIISETDLEPMQNTDILEHSNIHNEETNNRESSADEKEQ